MSPKAMRQASPTRVSDSSLRFVAWLESGRRRLGRGAARQRVCIVPRSGCIVRGHPFRDLRFRADSHRGRTRGYGLTAVLLSRRLAFGFGGGGVIGEIRVVTAMHSSRVV